MDLLRYVSQSLRRSPLVMVAAQINFEEVGSDIRHDQARSVQKRLGAGWDVIQSAPTHIAALTADGPVQEPRRQGYRIATKDDSWAVLVRTDAVTIETKTYGGWVEFRNKFQAAAEAVAEVFDPAQCVRVGLRYIDQIALPDGRESWDGLISGSLLGLAADERFRSGVVASEHRTLLQYEDGDRCLLRYGLFSDETRQNMFLLDYDVFGEGSDAFSVPAIMESAETLHGHMGRTFQTSVEDDLYRWLVGDDE